MKGKHKSTANSMRNRSALQHESMKNKLEELVRFINAIKQDFQQAIFYLNLNEEAFNHHDSLGDFAILMCLCIQELNLIERVVTQKEPLPPVMEEDLE